MGWASGTGVFGDIIEVLTELVDDVALRREIYVDLIEVFENHDCDNLDELEGEDEVFDLALRDAGVTFADEYYDDDESGEDSDDWPEGGREDFS